MDTRKLELVINVPATIALQSLDGTAVRSSYGGQQIRFTTVSGQSLYVNPNVAQRIRALNLKPGESFHLCKKQKPGGQRGLDWTVEKLGEQPDGTFKIQKADLSTEVLRPACTPHPNVDPNITRLVQQRKRFLWSHGTTLIDALAALVRYATEHHSGLVTRDDVRALLITAYIQSTRNAGARP